MDQYNLPIAELLLRVFAGILFFLQGYDKLFRIKMAGVVQTFRADADRYHIPVPLLNVVSYYTSIVEFVCGLMLVLGFFTTYALYALGIDLLLVCFAFTFMQPIWDMKHVFPRLILIIALLMMPNENHLFCLDHIFGLK